MTQNEVPLYPKCQIIYNHDIHYIITQLGGDFQYSGKEYKPTSGIQLTPQALVNIWQASNKLQ